MTQKWGDDVGCPICCEYVFLFWLVARQNRARWEIQTKIWRERKQSQGDAM